MKPLKAKERTSTSVSSDVLNDGSVCCSSFAAGVAWRNTLVSDSSFVDLSSSHIVIRIEET